MLLLVRDSNQYQHLPHIVFERKLQENFLFEHQLRNARHYETDKKLKKDNLNDLVFLYFEFKFAPQKF